MAAHGVKVELKVKEAAQSSSDDEDAAPPLCCFKVCDANGRPLFVGEKPSGTIRDAAKQLDYLSSCGVSSFISIATPNRKCVAHWPLCRVFS